VTEPIPAVLRDEVLADPGLAKHERAVANTLSWADHAAAYGEYAQALAWLNTLEAIGAELPEAYVAKRPAWARAYATRAELERRRKRLLSDQPSATRRMLSLSEDLDLAPERPVLLDRALEGAMTLFGTELGNVQITDPASGALTIATSSGFESEFLEYFAVVDDASSACGRAAQQSSPTVIADVDDDPGFAPHREIAAASRFRAVQSTPIVDPAGRLHGVISTHFRERHRPAALQMQLIAWYSERVGAALACHLHRRSSASSATA
jgi:GAF domain-containing protein